MNMSELILSNIKLFNSIFKRIPKTFACFEQSQNEKILLNGSHHKFSLQ